MPTIDQGPFRSDEERQQEKLLEAQYRDIANPQILAAMQIRRPDDRQAAKAAGHKR